MESGSLAPYAWDRAIVLPRRPTRPHARDFGISFLSSLFLICFITSFGQIISIIGHLLQEFYVRLDYGGRNHTRDICSGWDANLSSTCCGASFRSIGAMGESKVFNNDVISYQPDVDPKSKVF